jgi:hypothetical protein
MTLPDFLIIGAQKAGTTALYHYLKQHPQIYMSPVKEPHFFTYEGEKLDSQGPDRWLTRPITKIAAYRALFQGVLNGMVVGEASPSYLYSSKAPERIWQYIPNVKLIAVLRHPVDRAYSNFLHCTQYVPEPLTDFAQALREEEARIRNNWSFLWHYQQKGFYYVQLKRYFNLFERDQIKVYLYEDLKTNPVGVLQDIFWFLGVDQTFAPDVTTKHNVSGIPKNKVLHTLLMGLKPVITASKPLLPARVRQYAKNQILDKPPSLSPEVRQQMLQVYREDILQLQGLIQRDLSSWLE